MLKSLEFQAHTPTGHVARSVAKAHSHLHLSVFKTKSPTPNLKFLGDIPRASFLLFPPSLCYNLKQQLQPQVFCFVLFFEEGITLKMLLRPEHKTVSHLTFGRHLSFILTIKKGLLFLSQVFLKKRQMAKVYGHGNV